MTNIKSIKGYVLATLSGILLLAMLVLAIMQFGNKADFSLYGKNMSVNTALLVLMSALGGIVFVLLAWVHVKGLRSLMEGKRQRREAEPERSVS